MTWPPPVIAAQNYPLRGGKHSLFDGGIRVAAFASGGWLPVAQRGRWTDGLVAIEDWYRTFARLGGLRDDQITDHEAAAAGLPPVDSLDVSSLLLGTPGATPPRTDVALGSCAHARTDPFCQEDDPGPTVVSGVIAQIGGSLYKLLVGWIPLDCTTGAVYPPPNGSHAHCTRAWRGVPQRPSARDEPLRLYSSAPLPPPLAPASPPPRPRLGGGESLASTVAESKTALLAIDEEPNVDRPAPRR